MTTGGSNTGKKGFSGLSDLVSEIRENDTFAKPEPKAERKPSESEQQLPQKTPPAEPALETTSISPPSRNVNSGKSGDGSGSKAIFGFLAILGVVFVFWMFTQNNKQPAYKPPSSPQSSPAPAAPTSNNTRSAPQSAELQYTKPSVGTNNVLSVPEIQWCIREGIRIESMRDLIDTNAGINEFNQIVNGYNSRCGNYRYRQGTQLQAERSVESYRSQIVAEAIREARQLGRPYQPLYPPVSPTPSTNISTPEKPVVIDAPEKPSAEYTTEAQQLLTDLGYKPGPVDGGYGRRTADAVKAFQRDVGITQDGKIDQELLSILRSTANQRTISIEGKYEYADTGIQGGFTIKKEGSGYMIELQTVNIATLHTCGFGGRGKREGNVLNFDASSDQRKASVRVIFSSTGAELEDVGGAHMSWCGLSGWMAGKYRKIVQ